MTAVILFLLWCTFLLPSFKNTALIFPEIFLIEFCTVFVERFMTSSLPSFASYKNVNISKTKKDIPKRKIHSPLLWKAFQMNSYYFLLHRHFKHFKLLFHLIHCLRAHYSIDISFSCICPVIGHEFRHNIVKVVVDPQNTLTMLWRN